VNKEAQAKVSQAMDKFIAEDGGLLMYVTQDFHFRHRVLPHTATARSM